MAQGAKALRLHHCLDFGMPRGHWGLARLGQAPDGGTSSSVAGAVMILGALAYRSAKKRKLGEVKATLTRQFLEIVLLVLICLGILMQNNLKILIATDPIPNFVIRLRSKVAGPRARSGDRVWKFQTSCNVRRKPRRSASGRARRSKQQAALSNGGGFFVCSA